MKILKELIPYVIIIVVVIIIRTFIITPVRVNGDSMNPTLKSNEVMLLGKVGKIKRFDIVIINIKDDRLIKRVIGLPGETIAVKDGEIYINSKIIVDKFGDGTTFDFDTVALGKDEYFVMGDNRGNSKDSRFYGPFNKKEIQGTTKLVVFPFKNFGLVK